MKLIIIANPVAGGGRAFKSIQRYVQKWPHPEWEVELLTTRGPNHAGSLALQLLRNPPDLLAVCGGDGTFNEVATAIPAPSFPVALLPAGTANVLARELSLPMNPIKALKIALRKSIRSIDLGSLGPGTRRRFLFVAGIGFDAFVVAKVRPRLKSMFGILAYAFAINECLIRYSFPEFRITIGSRTFTATSCLACNAKRYGGGLLFCPDADMQDGLLDVLILEGRRRFGLALFLLLAWLQIPMKCKWIHRLRADSLRIEKSEGVFIQTDGELAGELPLDVGLTNASFPLVVP